MQNGLTTRYRIAEINIGIVYACVPVAFPLLFRGMAQTSSYRWYSWRQYRLKPKTPSSSESSLQTRQETRDGPMTQRGLPHVPKGNLRTLLSLVRGSQSASKGEKSQGGVTVTQATDVEMECSKYSEPGSVGVDHMYHAHLYEQQNSQRNLVITHLFGCTAALIQCWSRWSLFQQVDQ